MIRKPESEGWYDPAMTFDEIGLELGISGPHARAICDRALQKLARKVTVIQMRGLAEERQRIEMRLTRW